MGLVDEPVGLVVDMGGAVDEAEVGLWFKRLSFGHGGNSLKG